MAEDTTPANSVGKAPTVVPRPARLSRVQSRQRTRQQILDSATVLFFNDGYAATSLERIGERVGYTYGAVLGHFRTKDALAVAVLEQVYRRAHARVHGYHIRDHDHLLATVTTWMHAAITHPGWIRLEHALAAADGYRDTRGRLRDIHSTATDFITKAIDQARVDPAVDPATAASMLLSIAIGHATTSLDAITAAGLRLLVDHVLAPVDPQVPMSAGTSPAATDTWRELR
ncbi:TetR family transcriptional regulator [Nocardia sp. NPDC052278]|uniref:TetR family transcriptional regulator n=1 Tax=unclassified Nocardia TaxID=2637762 RepID=UPI00368F2E3B